MKHYSGIELFYFVGIGGIGMSALARYFKRQGKEVLGYDRQRTALTTSLELEGISVSYSDSPTDLPMLVHSLEATKIQVVYTPALSLQHPLLQRFQARGIHISKRSEVLGNITREGKTIAIAGTHGKTTTSSITAHLFHASGHGCNAFLGGIMANYDSNMLYSGSEAWNIVEADEFDRSFLTLSPDLAVITSMDADHLDIYGEAEVLREAFRDFSRLVKASGQRLVCERVAADLGEASETYGILPQADHYAHEVRHDGQKSTFSLRFPDGTVWTRLPLPLPGRHNLENTTVAVALARKAGIQEDEVRSALGSFRGIKRRFEYQANTGSSIFIDDYAHHPAELRATIEAVRERHPGKRITGVFQPHLFTRTRDHADGFAESLALLDEILLLDIYPAREEALPGIDSQWLLDKIPNPHKKCVSKSQLLLEIKQAPPEVLLTLGAGDIDREVEPIRRMLEKLNA